MTTTHGLGGDYPTDWSAFVGQDRAKGQLRRRARLARERGERLDHILLAAGPGIGKTSLALLVGAELGREVKVVSGKMRATEARIALADLSDGDVLIYDEIHQVCTGGSINAEWMLHLLQDGVIMGPTGPEQQPRVTVIGCTTHAGMLPSAVRDRFAITPVLEPYTIEQASDIAMRFAGSLFPDDLPLPTVANTNAIAEACRCSPRLMRAVVSNLRNIALCADVEHVDGQDYDLTEALAEQGLTPDGLDDLMRRYLVALLTDFAGSAGEKAMANRLQIPSAGLADIERVLADKAMVASTKGGRVLTGSGIRRARQIINEKVAA